MVDPQTPVLQTLRFSNKNGRIARYRLHSHPLTNIKIALLMPHNDQQPPAALQTGQSFAITQRPLSQKRTRKAKIGAEVTGQAASTDAGRRLSQWWLTATYHRIGEETHAARIRQKIWKFRCQSQILRITRNRQVVLPQRLRVPDSPRIPRWQHVPLA